LLKVVERGAVLNGRDFSRRESEGIRQRHIEPCLRSGFESAHYLSGIIGTLSKGLLQDFVDARQIDVGFMERDGTYGK
jgi:hypothetical protein